MKCFKILILSCLIVLGQSLFAEESSSSSMGMGSSPKSLAAEESLQDLTIVFASGIAGGILGLSTLSFVNQPSAHLKNISVGAALGVILGVGIVVFSQASKNTSFAESFKNSSTSDLTIMAMNLHDRRGELKKRDFGNILSDMPILSWSTSF